MVASAEAAAHISEMRVDPGRLEAAAGGAEKVRDRLRGLVGDWTPTTSSSALRPLSYHAMTALRLEKHRVDRLGLEFAVQHQNGRIARCKFGADLLAMGCGFGVGAPGRIGSRVHIGMPPVLEASRTDPAVLDRRINIGRVRGRAGNPGETKCAVVRRRDGTGFLAELQDVSVAQREPRLIESIELLEDQQRHGLAEIQRCFADRTEQIALVERGHADAGARQIGSRDHLRRLKIAAQARQIHSGEDMCRVGRPDEQACEVFDGQPGRSDARKSDA